MPANCYLQVNLMKPIIWKSNVSESKKEDGILRMTNTLLIAL